MLVDWLVEIKKKKIIKCNLNIRRKMSKTRNKASGWKKES